MAGWGDGGWGGGSEPWGSPEGSGAFAAWAARENVLRVRFPAQPYASSILDAGDALDPSHYSLEPVAGTFGSDGEEARACRPFAVRRVDGDAFAVDVVVDRLLSCHPARYVLGVSGVRDLAGAEEFEAGSVEVYGLRRVEEPFSIEGPAVARDAANPQVPRDQVQGQPLGGLPASGTGDYATVSGAASLRTRVIRRLTSLTNGYVHLSGYGLGLVQRGKRLLTDASLQQLEADGKRQVEEEPEVAAAMVTATRDPSTPSLVRYVVVIKMRTGEVDKFAFSAQAGS